jgi:hypothetical protein
VILSKTIKTEVSKQQGTEPRLGKESFPENRAWIPPSLRPQHGLSEEAQRDEIFRKVCDARYNFLKIIMHHNCHMASFSPLGSWYFEQAHTRKIPTSQR